MRVRQYLKMLFVFGTGGLLYNLLELAWRCWTHWTMCFLGGACFVSMGLINEILPWAMPIWQQMAIGACIITGLEFLTGCIVNLWLGWGVWDYSQMPGNLLGQICPQYFGMWLLVALAGIILDDCLRYWRWEEEQPHYNIGLTRHSSKIVWLPI